MMKESNYLGGHLADRLVAGVVVEHIVMSEVVEGNIKHDLQTLSMGSGNEVLEGVVAVARGVCV